jgi:hypothetical protein
MALVIRFSSLTSTFFGRKLQVDETKIICLVSHLGIVGIVILAVVTTPRDVYFHFDSPYNDWLGG